MKNRSKTDIVAQILNAANGGAAKTKIMYSAFLSHVQLKEYVAALTENGLLEYNENNQKFKTTDKGVRFLQIYDQMGEFKMPAQQVEK